MQQEPTRSLPPGERNALLIFFSKENAELKAQVANQQKTIEILQDRIKELQSSVGQPRSW